jgi:hypothetical protein
MTLRRLFLMITLAALAFLSTTPNVMATKRRMLCKYDKQSYRHGQSFLLKDGCTRCRCSYGRIGNCNKKVCVQNRICNGLDAYKKRITAMLKATRAAYKQLQAMQKGIVYSGRRIQYYQKLYKRTRNPLQKIRYLRIIVALKVRHRRMVLSYKSLAARVQKMAKSAKKMLSVYRALERRYPYCKRRAKTKCFVRNGRRYCRRFYRFQSSFNFNRLSSEMNGVLGGSGPKPRGFEGNFFEGNF